MNSLNKAGGVLRRVLKEERGGTLWRRMGKLIQESGKS